jgi:hypothetical protein
VLQTLSSDLNHHSGGTHFISEQGQNLNLTYWLDILKRRFFLFLGVFGLFSVIGLYVTAIQRPLYLSEGKILVQSPEVDPDIMTPAVTATVSERAQLIQHRVMTRDNLLLIANKFKLFPGISDASGIVDLMRKRTQFKPLPVEVDGQLRPNSRAVAFTVGFEYEIPEISIRVANELIRLVVSGDENSRSGRAAEMVRLQASQAKDIEDQLESKKLQIFEIARRPRSAVSEIPDEQKTELAALAALKVELAQKAAIYSDAHPVVVALRRKIAMMEKNLTQASRLPAQVPSSPDDDIEALKRQQQLLEKQLAEANGKLASARFREKLDLEQRDRMQIVEAPSLPEKPVKSKKIVMVGLVLVVSLALGLGIAIGPELLKGSITTRQQLIGVVDSSIIVCVPYISTPMDTVRTKLKILFAITSVVIVSVALATLVAAIALNWPIDFFHSASSGS